MVRFRSGSLALALTLAASSQGIAQEPRPGQSADGARRGIESITVTARKVEQDIQSTGEAVSAFTGADLEKQGIVEVKNLGRVIPNVRFENVPGTGTTATVTIRGISQADLLITGDPSVGIYTDGVYNARLVGGNFNFFDVERVEVLKGPQGTLYGKNTPAGAVNVWSRRPSPEFGGYLKGTYGSYQQMGAEGAVSFPIAGEELSGRIAFLHRDDDGYIKNHAAAGVTSNVDGHVADQNGKGLRTSLLWEPDDAWEVYAMAYGYRERRKGGFPHQVSYVDPTAINLGPPPPVVNPGNFDTAGWASFLAASDRDDIFTSFRGRQDMDTKGGTLSVSHDFGSAELKYLAGYRWYQFLNATDLDGSPYSLADVGRPDQPQDEKSRQSSHELTLTGRTLGDALAYTTGLYYFDERSSNDATQFFDTANFGALGFRTYGDLISRIRSYAAYAQLTYSLTERLDFVVGFRHTEERREITRETRSCVGIPCVPSGAFPGSIPRTDFHDRWDAPTWLAALELQATDDLFLYAKAGTGYRSGGFNGRGGTLGALAIPFDEEYVTNYEVGAKADWFDNLLRTNLALFYLKYKDRQVTELSSAAGIGSIIVNSGSADVSGAELEVWAEPLVDLRLGGSLGVNYFRGDNGNKPANSPRLTYYLWSEYTFPAFDFGSLRARLEWQYQSKNYTTSTRVTDLAPRQVAPPFGLLGGRIALDVPGIHSEIALVGTNLLDRTYYPAGVDFIPSNFGYRTRYYGAPRRIALELTYRFGADAS